MEFNPSPDCIIIIIIIIIMYNILTSNCMN